MSGDTAEVFHRLQARRSMCRDFSPEPVDAAVVTRLMTAALGAPAAGNTRGLELLLVEGAETRRYWETTMTAPRRESFRWPGLFDAPLLVVPYVSPAAYVERYAEPDKAHTGLGADPQSWAVPYWFVDGGAAVMALLLAVEAEGLGALLFGQFDHEPAVRAEFGVPEGYRAVGTVAIGRPRSGRDPGASATRGRPSPAEHVHFGHWSRSSRV